MLRTLSFVVGYAVILVLSTAASVAAADFGTAEEPSFAVPCPLIDAVMLASGGDHERPDAAFDGPGSKSPRQSFSSPLRCLFQP